MTTKWPLIAIFQQHRGLMAALVSQWSLLVNAMTYIHLACFGHFHLQTHIMFTPLLLTDDHQMTDAIIQHSKDGSSCNNLNISITRFYAQHILFLKGVLHPWALFLKTLCIFSKNKATLDKVSYGSGQKCSKEVKNHSFTSAEAIVVKLQWKMCKNQYFPCFEP